MSRCRMRKLVINGMDSRRIASADNIELGWLPEGVWRCGDVEIDGMAWQGRAKMWDPMLFQIKCDPEYQICGQMRTATHTELLHDTK